MKEKALDQNLLSVQTYVLGYAESDVSYVCDVKYGSEQLISWNRIYCVIPLRRDATER